MVELDLPSDPVSIVDTILLWATRERATDVHFSPLLGKIPVRARVDGELRDICELDAAIFRKVVARLKVLAEIDVAEKRRPQGGRFTMHLDDRPVDFRVSLLPTLHGESAVLRILDRQAGLKSIDDLGFSRREANIFRSLIANPSGIVVVTGPTGAGKTTTLYAALRTLAVTERNVVTIEDPIEYEIDRALQTAVRPELGITFASLLRSILRHDPDVLMIGEVRDADTAQVAVRAALTGHLVLTSLHTQSCAQAVTALLHFGVKPYALAPALRGVVAQQLVRTICPECKTTMEYGQELYSDPDLARVLPKGGTPSISMGEGCESCFQAGYRGRRAIFELMEVGEKLREAIFQVRSTTEIEKAAVESGMLTLRQRAFQVVLDGSTTVEEVVRAIPID